MRIHYAPCWILLVGFVCGTGGLFLISVEKIVKSRWLSEYVEKRLNKQIDHSGESFLWHYVMGGLCTSYGLSCLFLGYPLVTNLKKQVQNIADTLLPDQFVVPANNCVTYIALYKDSKPDVSTILLRECPMSDAV